MNKLLTEPNEWQYIDKRNGLLFAWYTKTFLDELKNWDVSNWNVLELGSGASTLWWGKMAKSVVSIEDNSEWYEYVKEGIEELNLKNVSYHYSPIEEMLKFLKDGKRYDCIIVDGELREQCMNLISENNLKFGGIVILDNFEFIPHITESNLFRTNRLNVYPQPHHYFWRTAYWKIENFEHISDNHTENSKNQKIRRYGNSL
jgi:predicted O-methyltransferase YrrM